MKTSKPQKSEAKYNSKSPTRLKIKCASILRVPHHVGSSCYTRQVELLLWTRFSKQIKLGHNYKQQSDKQFQNEPVYHLTPLSSQPHRIMTWWSLTKKCIFFPVVWSSYLQVFHSQLYTRKYLEYYNKQNQLLYCHDFKLFILVNWYMVHSSENRTLLVFSCKWKPAYKGIICILA